MIRGLRVLDPWKDFGSLQERINRMFDDTIRTLYPTDGEELEKGTWAPAVDIYETNDSFVVSADLPGLNKDEIQIDLKDNTLTLKGEKKFEEKVSKDNYIRVERAYGSFVRSFTLPQNVDPEKIKAKYKEGILEITIPKKEEAKPKQIKVELS
ncbi:MAG: molecular chaperone [Candidatus Dadabacteria bacterium RBG_19FT_COMBO_40_33]|nr:MAG: molecular chaperone [Candidatus Dadabacteria bacterium RBG_19FT_COMBO_40_33]